MLHLVFSVGHKIPRLLLASSFAVARVSVVAGFLSLPSGPVHEGFSHCSHSIAASSCPQSWPQTPQEVRPQMNATGVGCPLLGGSVIQEALWPCFLPHRLLLHVPPWCSFFRQLTTSPYGLWASLDHFLGLLSC